MRNNKISHEGEVLETDHNSIKVRILQNSACVECHAKAACNLSDKKEKIIEVPSNYPEVRAGDKVVVEASLSLGLQAVLYAFIIPVILVFGIIICLLQFHFREIIAALAAVVFLIVYYFLLYLSRERMTRKFVFTLRV